MDIVIVVGVVAIILLSGRFAIHRFPAWRERHLRRVRRMILHRKELHKMAVMAWHYRDDVLNKRGFTPQPPVKAPKKSSILGLPWPISRSTGHSHIGA